MFKNIPFLYLKRKELHVMLKAKMLACMHGLSTIDSLDIKKYKKSDTIFILGSGNSINSISADQWDFISKNDSLGLNFWIIHDFVPTFYCYEEPNNCGNRKDIFYDILNYKKDFLCKSPIIIKDLLPSKVSFERIPKDLKKNIYLSFDFDIPSKGSESVMMQYLLELKKSGRINPAKKIRYIYSITASLSYAVFFSLIMGYKKIVFCGVDLSDSLYFYEEQSEYYKSKGIIVPKSMQNPGLHSTDSKSHRKIPISHVLKVIYDLVAKENEVEFYVAKNYGALSKYFKVFF